LTPYIINGSADNPGTSRVHMKATHVAAQQRSLRRNIVVRNSRNYEEIRCLAGQLRRGNSSDTLPLSKAKTAIRNDELSIRGGKVPSSARSNLKNDRSIQSLPRTCDCQQRRRAKVVTKLLKRRSRVGGPYHSC